MAGLPNTLTLAALAGLAVACSETDPPIADPEAGWAVVHGELPGALLSVWGTSASDVWAVGADAGDGSGPQVLHFDGAAWTRRDTGLTSGDLWWVFGFAGGPVYLGGSGGVILRYDDGGFSAMTTPGSDTVFGIWGADPDDMWAVGGSADQNGFAWRLDGDSWIPEPSLPADVVATAAIWKVFGRSADDVVLVGSNGVSFAWDGSALSPADTGVGSSLFTVHANSDRYAAVGGLASGAIVENDGGGWQLASETPFGVAGVVLGAGETGCAVGQYGSVYMRTSGGWQEEDTGLDVQRDMHGVWLDPGGGVWAVGGQTSSFPLTEGVLIHKGDPITSEGI